MVAFLLNQYYLVRERFESGNDEEGQGLAEYALILALIAILAVAALLFLGGAINDILSSIGSVLNSSGA